MFVDQNRILQNKLLFLHHLVELENTTLAKQILIRQKEKNLVGPLREMCEILKDLGLPDITSKERSMSKKQWKSLVKRTILTKNEEEIKVKLKKYSKLKDDSIVDENFDKKSYLKSLNLMDSRLMYRIRSKTTGAKMNQKSDEDYSNELWKCEDCGNVDTQSHILWCPSYAPLREDKNISEEKDLVDYFREVFKFRESYH